jgi:hypothetical protein
MEINIVTAGIPDFFNQKLRSLRSDVLRGLKAHGTIDLTDFTSAEFFVQLSTVCEKTHEPFISMKLSGVTPSGARNLSQARLALEELLVEMVDKHNISKTGSPGKQIPVDISALVIDNTGYYYEGGVENGSVHVILNATG